MGARRRLSSRPRKSRRALLDVDHRPFWVDLWILCLTMISSDKAVRPANKRQFLIAVWGCLLASVVVLSLLPASFAPEQVVDDGLGHCLAYLVLAVIPMAALRRRGTALAAALSMIPLGILLEVLQIQIPGRAFEWKDAGSNSLGVMLGLVLGLPLRLRSTGPTEARSAGEPAKPGRESLAEP